MKGVEDRVRTVEKELEKKAKLEAKKAKGLTGK